MSDSLLHWVTPDETAAQFLLRQSREAVTTGMAFIDAHIKLRPGHVLEVVGPTGSAKSEIIVEVAANILCRATAVDNNDAEHVVVIDCDGKFDMLRLLQVLSAKIPAAALAAANTAAGTAQALTLTSVLPQFHLVRCFSSVELLLSLATLPQQLASLKGSCRMLLIDNIAAHQWQDRAAAAAAGSHWQHEMTSAAAATGAVDVQRLQGAAAALLRELSQQLRFPVIVTKQAGVSQDDRPEGTRLIQRELLTPQWQNLITHQLLLLPVTAPGSFLAQLAKGPQATEVLWQWQSPGFASAVERCKVTTAAIVGC